MTLILSPLLFTKKNTNYKIAQNYDYKFKKSNYDRSI